MRAEVAVAGWGSEYLVCGLSQLGGCVEITDKDPVFLQ